MSLTVSSIRILYTKQSGVRRNDSTGPALAQVHQLVCEKALNGLRGARRKPQPTRWRAVDLDERRGPYSLITPRPLLCFM
jgi:hypothetical protein